jgi:hypothetical protein
MLSPQNGRDGIAPRAALTSGAALASRRFDEE